MKKLTEKQQNFVNNKAHGVRSRDAAIAAGFSANSADVQASQLLARADIKAAIKQAKKELRAGGVTVPKDQDDIADPKTSMPKSKYDDPVTFLEDLMNHKYLPLAMRADAAKQLLPYKHARIGESGKKHNAKERAHDIAGTKTVGKQPSRNKFGPKLPPPLRLVRN